MSLIPPRKYFGPVLLAGILLCFHATAIAQQAPIIRLPDQGQRLDLSVGEIVIKSSSKETLGISQVTLLEQPGYATALQSHSRTDISYFVLEGVLTMRIRGQVVTYPAYSFIHIPKGTPHAHANLTNKPVRLFMTFSPGGYEQYFIERIAATKINKPGTPNYSKTMQAISDKYGITNIDLAPFKNLQKTR